ncbi:hypothetical protein D3C84_925190 [compost metagenome]
MGLAVPLGPLLGVLQTEVGREVDHPGAGVQQLAGQGMGDSMGRGEEDRVAGAQGFHVWHAEGEVVVMAAQVRIHVSDLHPGFGSRGDHRDLHLRMLSQQTQQFDTGIARAADDSDLDHLLPLQRTDWKVADDKAASARGQPPR